MGTNCYLCRRKVSKRDRISLHKFPKNPILRNKWIEACDLSLSDNLTYIYICSLHFRPQDIDRGHEFRSRCILRSGAVPLIGVPNSMYSNSNNKNRNIVNGESDNTDNIVEANEVEMISEYQNGNKLDTVVLDISTFNNVNANFHTFNNNIVIFQLVDTHIQELQLPTNASNEVAFEHGNGFIQPHRLDTKDPTVDSQVDRHFENFEGSCYSTSDFVQDSDEKKAKLIKSLRNRKRKLKKRRVALEKIIEDLKKKVGSRNWRNFAGTNVANKLDSSSATKMH